MTSNESPASVPMEPDDSAQIKRKLAWRMGIAGLMIVALLGGLAVNTFVCTTERVIHILAQRPARRELPFRLAPHLMHYAVLIILAGYGCSYLFSTSDTGRALRPGEQFTISDTGAVLQFHQFLPELMKGTRVDGFDGYVIRPNAQVTIHHQGQSTPAVLNFNEPLHVAGIGIYLAEFLPRKPGSGMGNTYIKLILRRDPSAVIYRFGMLVFVLGLALYVFERKFRR